MNDHTWDRTVLKNRPRRAAIFESANRFSKQTAAIRYILFCNDFPISNKLVFVSKR